MVAASANIYLPYKIIRQTGRLGDIAVLKCTTARQLMVAVEYRQANCDNKACRIASLSSGLKISVIYDDDDKDDLLWDALSYPNIPARRYLWR